MVWAETRMPTPTAQQLLSDPTFVKAMMNAVIDNAFLCSHPFTDLMKRPRFRKGREVHAQRARKLRRRGEHVYFVRWERGHCIYEWGGPAPDTFVMNRMPRKKSEPVYTQIEYRTVYTLAGAEHD